MDEIAITGMGILSSNAVDVVDFNEALIKGTSNFSVSSEEEKEIVEHLSRVSARDSP